MSILSRLEAKWCRWTASKKLMYHSAFNLPSPSAAGLHNECFARERRRSPIRGFRRQYGGKENDGSAMFAPDDIHLAHLVRQGIFEVDFRVAFGVWTLHGKYTITTFTTFKFCGSLTIHIERLFGMSKVLSPVTIEYNAIFAKLFGL